MICSSDQRTDKLLELMVEGCGYDEVELYNSIDTSEEINFSRKFERKMDKLFRKGKIEPVGVQVKRISSRVAIICLAFFSLCFMSMMSVSAIREAIWETIVELYNSYFEITVDDGDNSTQSETITEIQIVHKPATLPEGVEEEIVMDNKRMFMADYYKGDEHVATYRQVVLNETASVHVNSENVTISNCVINQKHITIIDYNNGLINMFWSDDYYLYTIDGYELEVLKDLISRIE